MKAEKQKRNPAHIAVNVTLAIAVILVIVLSSTLFGSTSDMRLLLRVLARGVLGLLLVYDSLYLVFTSKWSFLCIRATARQRLVCGILIGLTGLIGLVTALLGYGINGDPRLNWM